MGGQETCGSCSRPIADDEQACVHDDQVVCVKCHRRLSQKRQKPVEQASETRPGRIRHFFTKVAGVTHKNDDGSSRQEAISGVRVPGEMLQLVHDEFTEHSDHAIGVHSGIDQLGYLPDGMAKRFLADVRNGQRFCAFAWERTEFDDSDRVGLKLMIVVVTGGDVSNEALSRYLKQTLDFDVDFVSAS